MAQHIHIHLGKKTKDSAVGRRVKFKQFSKQKSVTGSINPNAVFTVTGQDREWLKLDNRWEVHEDEVTPVTKDVASFSALDMAAKKIKAKAAQVEDAVSEEERSRAEAYLRDIIQTAQNALR